MPRPSGQPRDSAALGEEAATTPQEGRFAELRSNAAVPAWALDLSENELALRFRQRIRMFAARRVQDASVAEDVAQETLRCVIEAVRANRIEHREALPAFVFQTARNVCLHWVRSAVRERSALARFGRESSTPSEGVDALSALISAERASVVRAALSALGDDDRELLTLMYFEGLDAAGVAARFGLTVSAVRVRKHRALHRLAVLLGESDGNESPASGTPE